MKRNRLNAALIIAGLLIIAAVLIARSRHNADSTPETAAALDSDRPSWSWLNPVTGNGTTLPPQWQEGGEQSVAGAVLTLRHWTGGAIIYLVHDETRLDVSLQEYAQARQESVQRELGIDRLGCPDSGGACLGEGAKLLGKTVAGTQVRIWRSEPRSFWRAAAIINPEYKNLKYDAAKIVDRLRETTP